MIRALSGIVMPRAFSTARTEASALTVVQTPQIRWVNTQASRGSRPARTVSMPRNMGLELQASVTLPELISASMRRCPSILVIGSTTIFMVSPAGWERAQGLRS